MKKLLYILLLFTTLQYNLKGNACEPVIKPKMTGLNSFRFPRIEEKDIHKWGPDTLVIDSQTAVILDLPDVSIENCIGMSDGESTFYYFPFLNGSLISIVICVTSEYNVYDAKSDSIISSQTRIINKAGGKMRSVRGLIKTFIRGNKSSFRPYFRSDRYESGPYSGISITISAQYIHKKDFDMVNKIFDNIEIIIRSQQ